MPRKKVEKITAFSYSRYSEYQTCPLKAKLKCIDNLKEPSNEAMERGSKIHGLAEDYLTRRIKRLPKELKLFDKEFKALLKDGAPLMVEEQWAFDKNWKSYDWFSKETYCRMMIDVAENYLEMGELVLIDHKTGKVRENHVEQCGLYALGAFMKFPDASRIVAKLWYLDQGVEVKEVFDRKKDLPRLKKLWKANVRPMLNDTFFAPRPNNFCRWCHFRKDNGGPCQY